MKKSKKIIQLFCTFIFLLIIYCVYGPYAINDKNIHTPNKAIEINTNNYDSLISTKRIGIIEFYSPKCPICGSLSWVIDSLFATFGDSVLVSACNIDTDTLWKKFNVEFVPTYIILKNGSEITRLSFIQNKPEVFDSLAFIIRKINVDSNIIDTNIVKDTTDTAIKIDSVINYISLDSLSFDTTVLRYNRIAMVFFYYINGLPCIHMDSVIKTIAPFYNNKAIIAKVDIEDQYEFCKKWGVYYVPQYLFFKDSALILQKDGIISADTIKAILDSLIKSIPKPVQLNESNFDSLVFVTNQIAMVEFFSPYCGACISMESIVNNLAKRFNNRALIGKVAIIDTTTKSSINNYLIQKYNLIYVPTFIFFKDSIEYCRKVGAIEEDSLASIIEQGLSKSF
jgi:thioredoxin 1